MTPITHLRTRIDDLSWRIEQAHEAGDTRELAQECNELERAVFLHEDELNREIAEIHTAKEQLHRLKARL